MGRRFRHAAWIALLGVLWAGCTYVRVVPPDVNPSTQEESRTVHALGGTLLSPRVVPLNCAGNGLSEVSVRGNVAYSFVSILTFGLWTPMDVSWKCAKDRVTP